MLKITLIGCLLIILTTLVHSGLTRICYFYLNSQTSGTKLMRVLVVEVVVLMIVLASLVEAGLWAGCYIYIGALESLEESLYFSLVTFSTLGYGDVVLDHPHRLLGGFEAANGIIIFGWSTALLITAIQRVQSIPNKMS